MSTMLNFQPCIPTSEGFQDNRQETRHTLMVDFRIRVRANRNWLITCEYHQDRLYKVKLDRIIKDDGEGKHGRY
jgi:hypothetical protein